MSGGVAVLVQLWKGDRNTKGGCTRVPTCLKVGAEVGHTLVEMSVRRAIAELGMRRAKSPIGYIHSTHVFEHSHWEHTSVQWEASMCGPVR